MADVATTSRPRSFLGAAVGRAAEVDWRRYVTYIGFVAIFAFFAVTLSDKGFLTETNLLNIVRQTATISVMAVAMTFVLSAGHIDLSVGAVAGLSSVTVAMTLDDWGLVVGIGAGLLTGLVVGSINGFLATNVGIPSFLVTLAMLGIAKGSAMWLSDTAAVPILDDNYNSAFGSGDIGPIPSLVIWTVIVATVGHIGLRKAPFGRRVLATGGNETAARFSGIDTSAITRRVLFVSSMAAALAGMLYAGRLHSGRFQLGEGDELSVIAAAVLGGTSLFGGYGTVIGSVMGALMIGMINNGLLLMGLEFHQQLIVRGVIILLAVAAGKKQS
jgi:ribose transport system permease protein